MQFVGIFVWSKALDNKSTTRVKSLKLTSWLVLIFVSVILAGLFFYEIPLFSKYLTSKYLFETRFVPHLLDAMTNALSVIGQCLLILCYWEQYIIWTCVNLMLIVMYSGKQVENGGEERLFSLVLQVYSKQRSTSICYSSGLCSQSIRRLAYGPGTLDGKMPNHLRRHRPFTMANPNYLFVLFILNLCITARFKPIRFVNSRGLFFSPFWLGRFFVGVTLVNGTRIWLDSIDWESDGLSREIGEIVGVLELDRIGEDRFSLCRISCSYNERSWRFLRAGDLSGFTISFNPAKYPCSSHSSLIS